MATNNSINLDVEAVILEALSRAYPIGSYYINETNSTNPATLLGFGTWVAVQNRTIVGKGSGTFATAGATGGAETHSHPLSDAGAAKVRMYAGYVYASTGTALGDFTPRYRSNGNNGGDALSSDTGRAGVGLYGNTDSASSLMPYIVAYVWKRTA